MLFPHSGTSVAMAYGQLNLKSFTRVFPSLPCNASRTDRASDIRRMYTDFGDRNQQTRLELGFPKDLRSSPVMLRLDSKDNLGRCEAGLKNEPVTSNAKFHVIRNIEIRRRFVIRCCVEVPFPSICISPEDSIGTISGEQCTNPRTESWTKTNAQGPVKAAFFDVDGTITRTNVVLAYFAVRMSELSYLRRLFWVPCFAVLSIFYLIVDNFDRATFNRIFYSNHYKGRSADSKNSIAALVYERYYKPRIFEGALEHIKELKQWGYHIVLVTGALDFQIAPLARELQADFVYAAELVEENGRFTGKLNGMATSNSEKAERVLDYAERFDVSLEDSLAFGDSIADISMLEMVGTPHAVNPDARLLAIALQRKWTVLSWTLKALKPTTAAEPLPA